MGSVKDLKVLEQAFENRAGLGNFVFSDRYSVFDWGEMPDHILNKGRALAFMAAYNFEELERRGIKSHYRGLVTDSLEPGSPAAWGPAAGGPGAGGTAAGGGKLLRFSDLPESSAGAKLADPTIQIKLARVYYPVAREFSNSEGGREVVYDYSFFDANRGRINNYLIGLEIIFRNGLPLGSSVFSTLERAAMISDRAESSRRQAEILKGLGLDHLPQAGEMLPAAVMNYTTKLESGDRMLTVEEALFISGLEEGEFRKLSSMALRVNDCITELAGRAGFQHFDGKIEVVYDNALSVCDVLGTFDENRFALNGEQISKEVLRQWYKNNQPEFGAACESWKKRGQGWQEQCPVKPVKLPRELVDLVSQLYMAGCNRYTGRKLFTVPELEMVLEKLKAYNR
ncbi:MAG TPA: phosphoribosylaminoimidazolesuccinocarboxamide synthase [Spirochaetales bacterium]|nr:phosphoribosylaminoimidazolesuccinocarboxamide synthase [Spirochaetales bacterium]